MDMTIPRPEPIRIIGLNCDDPEAVRKLMQGEPEILKSADIICGSSTILAQFQPMPDLRGRLLKLATPLEPIFDSLFELSRQGLKVVTLADGDPLFFGVGSSLVRRAPTHPVEITPAISTLQAACSRLKIPWHNVFCLCLHGLADLAPLYNAVATGQTICILTGAASPPDALARLLTDRGVDWYDAHIFESMGRPDEISLTLDIRDCAREHFGSSPTMLLVPRHKPRSPGVGLEENRFRGRYPYNRGVRGCILELLKIQPSSIVWDVGAGSGILALECCVLAHEGRVIALESNIGSCLDIQTNRKLLGAINLDISTEPAPGATDGLAQPDRIFINAFEEVDRETLLACIDALPRNGRLVLASTRQDRFYAFQESMAALNWPLETMQIQTSSFVGSNRQPDRALPVYLLAAQKP